MLRGRWLRRTLLCLLVAAAATFGPAILASFLTIEPVHRDIRLAATPAGVGSPGTELEFAL